jgi:hypothetical protein
MWHRRLSTFQSRCTRRTTGIRGGGDDVVVRLQDRLLLLHHRRPS